MSTAKVAVTPRAVGQMPFPKPDTPRLSFSLLVPARHEQAVLAHTVRRLLHQEHPVDDVLEGQCLGRGRHRPETSRVRAKLRRNGPEVPGGGRSAFRIGGHGALPFT